MTSDTGSLIQDTESAVKKAISHLEAELTKVRAGKANPVAPNPLTKLRRLADASLRGECSLCNVLSGAM